MACYRYQFFIVLPICFICMHLLLPSGCGCANRAGLSNRFCQSVCLSVVKKILKSVLCAQYTALKNIGIREKRIYFPSWAPVSSTWLFLGRKSHVDDQVRPAYRNCKLRANTDGMHGFARFCVIFLTACTFSLKKIFVWG